MSNLIGEEKKKEFDNEKKNLEKVVNFSQVNLDKVMEDFDQLEYKVKRWPEAYHIKYDVEKRKKIIYENGINKPYFGRIDFKSDKGEDHKIYIGKYAINDEDMNQYVIDWRAPISTLYYDSELGDTSYTTPNGEAKGELLLKRQFDIENGKLNNYYDIDLISNDNLLQKYLIENNDARLKNIISTIQAEQNNAIRQPINKNIIVQGVAGSGKTTIALHRIAYLVYNYINTIKNNQYLIIGPNDVFLRYIKGVLPDLDVSNIEQRTFESFVKKVLKEPDLVIKNPTKIQNKYIKGELENDIPKFKNSLEYKEMISSFMDEYIKNICNSDLIINGFKILDKIKLQAILETSIKDTSDFNKAIERFILLTSYYIENNIQEITVNFNKQSRIRFEESKQNNTMEKCRNDIKACKEELNKLCKTSIRKYINKYKISSVQLYKKFINSIENYDIYNYPYLRTLKKETLENIKNNEFDFEDLAGLLYINCKFGVDMEEKNYKHVVIDEAQDLGEFNFYVLKKCLPNASFSIFGDIAQSIYGYRSIDSWNEVMNIFDNCELMSFKKSYRTTDEIMTVANEISKVLNIDEAELSVRHGEDVKFSKVNSDDIVSEIKNKIEKYKNEGYKTIAVVSKYPLQSNYINDDLSFEGLVIPNIEQDTDITIPGNEIVTVSNSYAKGLEFDVVIINDASENIYHSNSTADMKLLYVALTRALHKLDVVYTGDICKPLQKFIEKEKVLAKKM